MSNILAFPGRQRPTSQDTCERLIACFAQRRQPETEVFWLKENAELLGILAVTGQKLDRDALVPFAPFYNELPQRLEFFPQYYRFLISLCLDLETLGIEGDMGRQLCRWAQEHGLAEAELSDLQRAEARRLLARRDPKIALDADALAERLRAFMARSQTFAIPNRKAAYELTHIVFYLSNYGARDPGLEREALTSLEFAGIVAFLDQDMDLLAEICVALVYAGVEPSRLWQDAVVACHRGIELTDARSGRYDAYHEYLVTGWAASLLVNDAFRTEVPEGRPCFYRPNTARSALGPLSTCLKDLGEGRLADWNLMKPHVMARLTPEAIGIVLNAERSTAHFESFFECFARVSRVQPRQEQIGIATGA
ncbi:MAG: hypothetical protein AAF755_10825 [Pseudomonadota bacterium]